MILRLMLSVPEDKLDDTENPPIFMKDLTEEHFEINPKNPTGSRSERQFCLLLREKKFDFILKVPGYRSIPISFHFPLLSEDGQVDLTAKFLYEVCKSNTPKKKKVYRTRIADTDNEGNMIVHMEAYLPSDDDKVFQALIIDGWTSINHRKAKTLYGYNLPALAVG